MKRSTLATHVSAVVRDSTFRLAELAKLMWNPEFCSSDGTDDARDFVRALRAFAYGIEQRIDGGK